MKKKAIKAALIDTFSLTMEQMTMCNVKGIAHHVGLTDNYHVLCSFRQQGCLFLHPSTCCLVWALSALMYSSICNAMTTVGQRFHLIRLHWLMIHDITMYTVHICVQYLAIMEVEYLNFSLQCSKIKKPISLPFFQALICLPQLSKFMKGEKTFKVIQN